MIDHPSKPVRCYFTDVARLAAAEGRRRQRETRGALDAPTVFAVRMVPPSKPFGREIRRYGSLVLRQGVEVFDTAAEARDAGEAALAAG